MYSSPNTPTGTGRRPASSTCSRVLASAGPIGTGPSPTGPDSRCAVDQTVVSVGPYTFQTVPSAVRIRSARAGGSASPPHSARTRGACQPDSISWCQVAGVAWTTVTGAASSSFASRAPSRAVSRSTTRTVAPHASGTSSSSTAMSKEAVVTAATVSPAVSSSLRTMSRAKLASARCGTVTPFGRPVEPEVYRAYASCSGSSRTGSKSGSKSARALPSPASASRSTTATPSGACAAPDRPDTTSTRAPLSVSM